jgi:hypothetical protein
MLKQPSIDDIKPNSLEMHICNVDERNARKLDEGSQCCGNEYPVSEGSGEPAGEDISPRCPRLKPVMSRRLMFRKSKYVQTLNYVEREIKTTSIYTFRQMPADYESV